MKRFLMKIFWCLTRTYLRLRGVEVGSRVRCNGLPLIRIQKGGRLILEDGVQINAHPRWNAHVIPGSTTLFVAKGATLRVGARSGFSGTRIVAMESVEIGEGCMIGGGCLICDSDMHEIPLGSDRPIRKKPITIGDRVFLGAQSIILKGVTIGDGAVVGAGAVVTRPVGAGQLAAGNPVKILDLPPENQ